MEVTGCGEQVCFNVLQDRSLPMEARLLAVKLLHWKCRLDLGQVPTEAQQQLASSLFAYIMESSRYGQLQLSRRTGPGADNRRPAAPFCAALLCLVLGRTGNEQGNILFHACLALSALVLNPVTNMSPVQMLTKYGAHWVGGAMLPGNRVPVATVATAAAMLTLWRGTAPRSCA